MSAGQTDGKDLTVETLEFIDSNWDAAANTFDRSSPGGTPWQQPVLRNGDDKTFYPGGETTNYSAALRNNDVVTVEDGGRIDSPIGTEYDADVEHEVDVTAEAINTNFTVIDGSSDWKVFLLVLRRAILTAREYPIVDPNGIFEWRWLEISNEATLPETEDNRDHYGTEFTVTWYGYESLP